AAEGLEVFVFARNRVRFRTASRHERLQGAASALGQGLDADGQENSAESVPVGCAVSCEVRGVFSPDREYFVSIDGAAFDDAAAGDDRALLSGLVSDAGD